MCPLLPCWVRRSLHSVHDEEKPFEMELAWICDASGREFKCVPAELAAAAERQAKAALADSDMCAPCSFAAPEWGFAEKPSLAHP